MLCMLGDYFNLLFFFGVVIQREFYVFVMQFYGIGEESIIFYNVVKERIFNKQLMVKVFIEIFLVFGYVYSREIVYNDLKLNNVIIQ